MSTGQPPKKRASENKTPHATNFKVENGKQRPAYIAGPLHGVPGHRTHAHQPCLRLVTDGALECPYCTAGLDEVWRGYVPLWDRDWVLHYALIGEEYYPTLCTMKRGDQVMVSRAKSSKAPLVIHAETSFVRGLPEDAPHNADVSALALCLRLWQIDALTLWYQRKAAIGDGPAKAKVIAAKPVNRIASEVDRLNKHVLLGAAVDEWREEGKGQLPPVAPPSSNGHHKKPKG